MATTQQKRETSRNLIKAMKAAGLLPGKATWVWASSFAEAHTPGNEAPTAIVEALEAQGYTVEATKHHHFSGQHMGWDIRVESARIV